MDAATLARYCAVRELVYVEQGLAKGAKGAWFMTRRREKVFVSEVEIVEFNERVREQSSRRKQVSASFTS